MLGREGNARYWAWLMLEPVRYADRPVEEEYPDQFDTTAPLPETAGTRATEISLVKAARP
jgi:hypothetical protein